MEGDVGLDEEFLSVDLAVEQCEERGHLGDVGGGGVAGSPEYAARGTYRYFPPYQTPTTLKDVHISQNYLYNVMTLMNDGACIYTLSAMPGSTIDGNFCRDSMAPAALYSFGFYLDEGSRFITVTNNVLVRDGSVYTGSWSNDGVVWHRIGNPVTVPGVATTQDAGMIWTSHAASISGTATFDSFSVKGS